MVSRVQFSSSEIDRQPASASRHEKAVRWSGRTGQKPDGWQTGRTATRLAQKVLDFLAGCGMDDEGFYDALVRMFKQALKCVLALPTAQQATFLARLRRVK